MALSQDILFNFSVLFPFILCPNDFPLFMIARPRSPAVVICITSQERWKKRQKFCSRLIYITKNTKLISPPMDEISVLGQYHFGDVMKGSESCRRKIYFHCLSYKGDEEKKYSIDIIPLKSLS